MINLLHLWASVLRNRILNHAKWEWDDHVAEVRETESQVRRVPAKRTHETSPYWNCVYLCCLPALTSVTQRNALFKRLEGFKRSTQYIKYEKSWIFFMLQRHSVNLCLYAPSLILELWNSAETWRSRIVTIINLRQLIQLRARISSRAQCFTIQPS